MIRNESEYREAVERLTAENQRMQELGERLQGEGMPAAAIKNLMDPIRSFHLQLQEEVESYERLKRGQFEELTNLRGLGHLLVSLRISRGMTQRELAGRLGVHESQVSRDERNEYHGVSVERVTKILEALGAELRTKVESVSMEAA
jgi:ribosome-binding protein aMBF1 (putative translation factor)